MPDACAFFFCAWCAWCACAAGVCVWTHLFVKGRFSLLFLLLLEYGKEKYSASNLTRSRLQWPFGRVNVAASSIFFSFSLVYPTTPVRYSQQSTNSLFSPCTRVFTPNFTSAHSMCLILLFTVD